MDRCCIRRFETLVTLLGLALSTTSTPTAFAIDRLNVGDPLPNFRLPRADGDGGTYSSDQVLGKPAAVVFWRPGQRLSLDSLRDVKSILNELGDAKINAIAVDTTRATSEDIRKALAGALLPFPLLTDPDRDFYKSVGVIATPTTLVADAKGILRFVLPSHPRTFHRNLRARLRFLLGAIDEKQMEEDSHPEVLRIDHELAVAWRLYNLGRRLQANGKTDQAMSAFENAVSSYPSLPQPRCAIGFMKLSDGDLASAAKHFQSALSHSPASALARLGKAVVLSRTAKKDEAESILLSIVGQGSVAARASFELGRIYQARGQLDRAVTFYREALTIVFPEPLETDTAEAHSRLATDPRPSPGPSIPVRSVDTRKASPVIRQPQRPGGHESPTTAAPPGAEGTASSTPEAVVEQVPASGPSRPKVDPVVPPADTEFLGIMGCKKCHFQQWNSWKGTKMAAAFDLLKPGVRTQEKKARSLDPTKDYRTDSTCLPCHTTGYGWPEGYPEDPEADGRQPSTLAYLEGVGCESCHGPGEKYVNAHKNVQEKQREYEFAEFMEAGQYQLDTSVCVACHVSTAPCIAPGSIFDFSKRREEGTHKHYELRFRSR